MSVSRFIKRGCLILIAAGFWSCSSDRSSETWRTIACWLRPSCQPSQLHSSSRSPTPPSPPPATQPRSSPSPPSGQTLASQPAHRVQPSKCRTSVKTTLGPSKRSLTISYTEPTTLANGAALTNLEKTTIYYDIGEGLVKAKDVPATDSKGGGKVSETVKVLVEPGKALQATICVTATRSNGRES